MGNKLNSLGVKAGSTITMATFNRIWLAYDPNNKGDITIENAINFLRDFAQAIEIEFTNELAESTLKECRRTPNGTLSKIEFQRLFASIIKKTSLANLKSVNLSKSLKNLTGIRIVFSPNQVKFFRIAFYGNKFEKNGMSYIIRRGLQERLTSLIDQYRDSYTKKLPPNYVLKFISYTDDVQELRRMEKEKNNGETQNEEHYIEITKVETVMNYRGKMLKRGLSDMNKGNLFELQKYKTRTFMFESFNHKGDEKNERKLVTQYRKVSIFTTSKEFQPNDTTDHFRIVGVNEETLDPLENAINVMDDRNKVLWEALIMEDSPSKITIISGILYGNLMTRIGEGPLGIYSTFLDPKMDKLNYQEEKLIQLKLYMNQFIVFTQRAIEVFGEGMTSNMTPWFKESIIEYRKLRDLMYDRSWDSQLIDILPPFDPLEEEEEDKNPQPRKQNQQDDFSLRPSLLSASANEVHNVESVPILTSSSTPTSKSTDCILKFVEDIEEPPLTTPFEFKQFFRSLRDSGDYINFIQNPFDNFITHHDDFDFSLNGNNNNSSNVVELKDVRLLPLSNDVVGNVDKNDFISENNDN